jgi:hypothetical protein
MHSSTISTTHNINSKILNHSDLLTYLATGKVVTAVMLQNTRAFLQMAGSTDMMHIIADELCNFLHMHSWLYILRQVQNTGCNYELSTITGTRYNINWYYIHRIESKRWKSAALLSPVYDSEREREGDVSDNTPQYALG